jgi:nitroimidazol reductase NimA-like FMN-containing flavoprotein (pyridoxamine 5'-phosphate oxidase superfamily)
VTERPTDHAGVEILDFSECLRLLFARRIGRVGFVEDGELTILPVRYLLHDGKVVFRSAVGAKLDAAVRQAAVAFEVDNWDEEQRTGWSVLVHGTAHHVTDSSEEKALEQLGLESWVQSPQATQWIAIHPQEITGRTVPTRDSH